MPDHFDTSDGRRAGYPATTGFSDGDDPAAIRAEIQKTRDRMERTVDELGHRLNPDRVKGRIKQNLHDATVGKAEHMARKAVDRAEETRHSMMDTLRDNPIPAAMVGIGLGWLMVNARRDDERDYRGFGEPIPRGQARRVEMGYTTLETDTDYWTDDLSAQRYRAGIDQERTMGGAGGRAAGMGEAARDWGEDVSERARDEVREVADRAREEAHRAKDRVTEIAHEARDTTRDLTDRARGRIDYGTERARSIRGEFTQRARSGAGRVEHRFDDAIHDSPLAIGAAAVALGMAVGLTAPTTEREAEVLGPKRDELMDRARHEAGEMKGRARHVAERVADEVRTTAREAAREEGLIGDQGSQSQEPFGTPTGL